MFFGLGLGVGGTVSAFAEEYYTPYHVFFFNFLVMAAITVVSATLGSELETNKYAKMVDGAEREYQETLAANLALAGQPLEEGAELPRIPFFQGVRMRWKTMKLGISVPLVKRFYGFLLLQGFMPDFGDFTYYFALDVLGLSKFTLGMSTLIAGVAVILGPIAYQHYCHSTQFPKLFFWSQIINVVQAVLMLLLALRVNSSLGLSDLLLYLLTGSFAEAVERMMTIIPSFIIMAKIIPPGVEGSMVALTATIINLNQFLIRGSFGALLNDLFVGVTTAHLEKYPTLAWIYLFGKFFPFFFIFALIPKNEEVQALQQRYLDEQEEFTNKRQQ